MEFILLARNGPKHKLHMRITSEMSFAREGTIVMEFLVSKYRLKHIPNVNRALFMYEINDGAA